MTFNTFSLCPFWVCPLHLSNQKYPRPQKDYIRKNELSELFLARLHSQVHIRSFKNKKVFACASVSYGTKSIRYDYIKACLANCLCCQATSTIVCNSCPANYWHWEFRGPWCCGTNPGKSHPWTNTSAGGNFRRTFRTIQEKVCTNDWSVWISPEIRMDQWRSKFSESFSLDRYWCTEFKSPRRGPAARGPAS